MFTPNTFTRSLSAFNPVARSWTALPLRQHTASLPSPPLPRPATRREQLSLVTWNIHATPLKRLERSQLILDRILDSNSPDIVFLQEVATDVRQSVLDHARVRARFFTSDAEDDSAFKNVPFATMTLLSNERFTSSPFLAEGKEGGGGGRVSEMMKLHSVFRMTLPSRFGRDALCVNLHDPATPGQVFRLVNVHLDSLDSYFRRAFEVHLLNGLLREGGCGGGVIAGDFNAIDPLDLTLVEKHGLDDAWSKLRGETKGDDGATWGVGVELERGLKPGRLDKVVVLGLEPVDIEVLRPGRVDGGMRWSDHCGLRCTFRV
ncbi:Endonuclease/exonuclease/phosphatase [Ephemerocybe angulata]|uniref:Endonuclease/exonuclease/phosphatase n=1 Tax=Ephemerocybe angulata TaxID=980116 RepID=A0A8H6M362_9AGAR|nr:Endonuclease/exonuclease/phosphatase [Tulosesus angulatus]